MIEPHISGSNHTLYELGRIVLTFALIGLAIWLVIKLMVRRNRGSDRGVSGVNRQQRRAERARAKRRRR